ncbi:FAD-dependent oxidoreductase [Bradyrhizobium cosmicum]|uniref:FAD-dependent oxidoreductase n=1 Tax=Bradyrhizobium cosmicum TaxID=1404864 RepID=UPI0028E5A94A|nr:FAD-dependent oxidoreductase [Bradyrhizobium cosmicum]
MTRIDAVDCNASIAIVGAGPAGLSTAWFLSKHGFHNVTVLEKLGQIGGLCKSLTVDGMSYDLGANYVTWAYRETLEIADEVGATTYAEKPYTSIDIAPDGNSFKYRSLTEAVLYDPYTKSTISWWTFLWAAIRYLYVRWQLSGIIDAPDYLDAIHEHPELCVDFKSWLAKQDLMPLATLFQFPITIMGYGQLDDIAAPYALRYMSVRTFFPMVFGHGPVNWIIGTWPRRFTDGFQRLWERVSWRVNVRLNVNITRIERSAAGVRIDMEYPEQDLNDIKIVKDTKLYDYLVLACPLTVDVFTRLGLVPNAAEQKLNREIQINPYCMTTFWIDLTMAAPVAPVLPLTEQGTPWAVARQFQDSGNMFTQFYTRPKDKQTHDQVIAEVRRLTKLLGGAIDTSQPRWHTFDEFTYFQHFKPEQIKTGMYADLARMQGGERTFYVGGATDFELVEPIVVHSKYIVEKHFAGGLRAK